MLLFCAGVWLQCGTARAWSVGGHLGLNLDHADIHVGVDLLFPVFELSPTVELAIWPSFAHVFTRDDRHDVELFGLDVPFIFKLNAPVWLFVGPGHGIAIYDQVSLKLNVIGGVFFNPRGTVRPFAEMALRFIDGTFVDAISGVLVEL